MRLASIFFAIAVLVLAAPYCLLAQSSGHIEGTIGDTLSHEKLSGANVWIEGTGLGTTANLSGHYVIARVPAGRYTLLVRYIGYKSKRAFVEVKEGETLVRDFSLVPEAIEGETVTVTAQARGQQGAINQQLSSNTITSVVSAEKIHELPDASAATALSRLPGVSLMNGDQVVIRGVQAKLNTVLINGIQIPSTDMNDRSTNLGFISSNLLSGIEVIKVLTPDLDANTIGGVVNLRLREAPSNFHGDIFIQGSYNSQDHVTDNYKFWASVSDRFLDDKFGVFIQGSIDQTDQGQDVAAATYGINGISSLAYGEAPYQMNSFAFQDQWNVVTNSSVSAIMDYQLPHGKIIFSNTFATNLSNNTTFRNSLDFAATSLSYTLARDKYGKGMMINALQGEYNFGDIKAELSLSHSFTNKYTYVRFGDVGSNFTFENPTDNHPFGLDADGNAVQYIAQRQFFTPDDVYGIQIDPTDVLKATVQGWVITRNETFNQHVYTSNLDFTIPITITEDITSKFKIGGKITRATRANDVNSTFTGSTDDDYYNATRNYFPNHQGLSVPNPVLFTDVWDRDYKRGEYFMNGDYMFKYAYARDLMDDYMGVSVSGWNSATHKPTSTRDDYSGAELFSAGYVMGSFEFGPQISLIAGARLEHFNMDYRAKFVYVTHSVYGYANIYDTLNTIDRSDDNFFPNAQLRYKINEWSDVRLAYSRGVARPDFRAILPNIYIEPGGAAQAGNTKLKPAIADNLDAMVSVYNNDIGLLTIGGFYKKINDVFYQTNIFFKNLSYYNISFPDSLTFSALGIKPAGMPTASQLVTTYVNNPNPAYVRGLEVEWQTNFWYLPRPLNTLVLTVNYTKSWSDMDYQQIRNIDSAYQDPLNPRITRHKYITIDTLRNARLLFQSNDVLNMALGVDYKDFSGRLSFNLQGNVITAVGNRPEEDQFTGNIYRWDLTLQQKLPIEGFRVVFDAVNLFHNPIKTYQKFRRTANGEVLENLQSTAYSPRFIQLSLRYSL